MRIKGPGDFRDVHNKNMSEETKLNLEAARKEGLQVIKKILARFETGEDSVYYPLSLDSSTRVFVLETLRSAGWWVLQKEDEIRVYHPNTHDDGRL
jgi:hypothetical protein